MAAGLVACNSAGEDLNAPLTEPAAHRAGAPEGYRLQALDPGPVRPAEPRPVVGESRGYEGGTGGERDQAVHQEIPEG